MPNENFLMLSSASGKTYFSLCVSYSTGALMLCYEMHVLCAGALSIWLNPHGSSSDGTVKRSHPF